MPRRPDINMAGRAIRGRPRLKVEEDDESNQRASWPFTTAQRGSTQPGQSQRKEFSSMRKSKHIGVGRYNSLR
jgi:hypothetical protein